MRRLLAIVIASAMIVSIPTAFSATPKVGGSCTKINQFYESKSTLLVCATTKGKKTWRKATSVEKSLYVKEKARLAKAAAAKAAADAAVNVGPTTSASSTPTPLPTVSVTPTPVPTVSVTPTPIPTVSVTPTPIPTVSIKPTPVPTVSVTPTPVPTVSVTPTPVPTVSVTPTPIPTVSVTPTPTVSPSPSPTPFITFAEIGPLNIKYGSGLPGNPRYYLDAISSNGLEVVFTSNTPSICTIYGPNANQLDLIRDGQCSITASQSNTNAQNPASVTKVISIIKENNEIWNFSLSTSFPQYSQQLYATSTSDLEVNYVSSTSTVCTVNRNNSNAKWYISLISVGICTITASQPGDNFHYPAPSLTLSVTIVRRDQTITVSYSGESRFGYVSLSLKKTHIVEATASSGLPVTIVNSSPDICSLNGNVLTMVSAGLCRITANQSGDNFWNPAPQSNSGISANKLTQTISFTFPPSSLKGEQLPYQLSASSDAGLPITFVSYTPNICSVFGSQINMVKWGVCSVAATQDGSTFYNTAAGVVRNITLLQKSTTLTIADIPTYISNRYQILATSNSDAQLYVTSYNPTVCRFEGLTLVPIGPGTCGFNVQAPATDTFEAATSIWFGPRMVGIPG